MESQFNKPLFNVKLLGITIFFGPAKVTVCKMYGTENLDLMNFDLMNSSIYSIHGRLESNNFTKEEEKLTFWESLQNGVVVPSFERKLQIEGDFCLKKDVKAA